MDHRHHVRPATTAEPGELKLDEEAALAELKQFDSTRWAGYSETHPGAQVLDILQESTTILRTHTSTLLSLALLLAVPVSSLLLSHALLRLPFIAQMVISLQLAAQARLHPAGYRRLAEIVTSSIINVPFSALLSPLLKASVSYVVAATYARKKLKWGEIFKSLHKNALVLVQTLLWTCAMSFAFASAIAVLIGCASGLVVASVVAVAIAAGMAFASVVSNLAYVVSMLEGSSGREALVQSVGLLKGNLEVALLLFLVTNVNGTLLDVLFEFHVLRHGDAEILYDKYWEAPLLVGMHSFVHLFDAIMVSVLYFICKSTAIGGDLDADAADELLAEVRNSPVASRCP